MDFGQGKAYLTLFSSVQALSWIHSVLKMQEGRLYVASPSPELAAASKTQPGPQLPTCGSVMRAKEGFKAEPGTIS